MSLHGFPMFFPSPDNNSLSSASSSFYLYDHFEDRAFTLWLTFTLPVLFAWLLWGEFLLLQLPVAMWPLCWCSAPLCCVCHTLPGHTVPFYVVPCCAMPCHAVPCHAMPCHAALPGPAHLLSPLYPALLLHSPGLSFVPSTLGSWVTESGLHNSKEWGSSYEIQRCACKE